MKRALVASKAKVEGVVQEKFSGAPPQTPSCCAHPIKNPGGATAIFTFFENQSNSSLRSFSNLITISCISLPHANMVLSSAKLHISDSRQNKQRNGTTAKQATQWQNFEFSYES